MVFSAFDCWIRASAVTSGRPSTIAVASTMRSSGSDFSVFGDDHRLRFDRDFVQDGQAIGLKTPAGIVFSRF
jgi:hypothetical protein